MRCLLRDAGMLLRRRSCSGPLLLLLGVAVCLFYQTLVVARNRLRSGPQQPAADVRSRKPSDEVLMEETRRFISTLETLQVSFTWDDAVMTLLSPWLQVYSSVLLVYFCKT